MKHSISKRIKWIDVAKGIGVFLIVLGHFLSEGALRQWIFAFHVPLFFILSGVVWNKQQVDCRISKFCVVKFKRLLVPYLVFSMISIIIYRCLVQIILSTEIQTSLWQDIIVVLYGNSRPHSMIWNSPLWFLPCLFVTLLLVMVIEKTIKGRYRPIVILASMVAGIILQMVSDVRLPLHLESAVFMVSFVEVGIVIKDSDIVHSIGQRKKTETVLLIMLLFILGTAASYVNGFAEVRIFDYGKKPVLFVFSAVLLSFATILTALLLEKCKWLIAAGSYSMIIMLIHKFPILFFDKVLPVTQKVLNGSDLWLCELCAIILSVVVIIMCVEAGKIFLFISPEIVKKVRSRL